MVQRGTKIKSSFSYNLLFGGTAGIISRTIVSPLDRVKILMQTTKKSNKSFIIVMTDTIKQEGFHNLWKGNMLNCIRIFPYSSIQFTIYDYSKNISNINNEDMNIFHRLLFGTIAGSCATTITHPMDVIRHRLMCYSHINSIKYAINDIYKEKGYRSFFKGYGTSIISLTPFIATNFATYDYLKNKFSVDSSLSILALGAISAIFSQTICYPLDTVRRRMLLKDNPYKHGFDAFTKIIKKEGFRALYSGMVPNIIKIVPNNSIRFCAYEFIKQSIL